MLTEKKAGQPKDWTLMLFETPVLPGNTLRMFARNRQFPSFHNHAYLSNWRDRTTVMCVKFPQCSFHI